MSSQVQYDSFTHILSKYVLSILPIFYAYLLSSFTYILCIIVDIGTGCIVSSGDNSESKCIHVTALDDENALLEDDDDLCLYHRTLDLDEGNIDQFIECVQCRYTSIPLYTSHLYQT